MVHSKYITFQRSWNCNRAAHLQYMNNICVDLMLHMVNTLPIKCSFRLNRSSPHYISYVVIVCRVKFLNVGIFLDFFLIPIIPWIYNYNNSSLSAFNYSSRNLELIFIHSEVQAYDGFRCTVYWCHDRTYINIVSINLNIFFRFIITSYTSYTSYTILCDL